MAEQENPVTPRPKFGDLDWSVGSPLTIETRTPHRKYSVKLIGYVERRSLLISAPLKNGKESILELGSSLVVRLLDGQCASAFETQVLYRSLHPYSYYHLACPEEIESLQVRDSQRIETSMVAQIDSDFDIVGEWPKQATILNLSQTGARLNAAEFLGLVGHELLITFRLQVSGMLKKVRVTGIIRNTDKVTDQESNELHVIGVQFLKLSDAASLLLANFVHEHH